MVNVDSANVTIANSKSIGMFIGFPGAGLKSETPITNPIKKLADQKTTKTGRRSVGGSNWFSAIFFGDGIWRLKMVFQVKN